MSWALDTLTLLVHPRHLVEYTTIVSYWRLQLYWSGGVTSTDSQHNICHGSNFDWQCDHWLCFFSSVDLWPLHPDHVLQCYWPVTVFLSQCGCWLHPLEYLWTLTFHCFSPVWRDSTLVPRPPRPAFVACSTKSGGRPVQIYPVLRASADVTFILLTSGFVLSPSLFFPWIQFVLSVQFVLRILLLQIVRATCRARV